MCKHELAFCNTSGRGLVVFGDREIKCNGKNIKVIDNLTLNKMYFLKIGGGWSIKGISGIRLFSISRRLKVIYGIGMLTISKKN